MSRKSRRQLVYIDRVPNLRGKGDEVDQFHHRIFGLPKAASRTDQIDTLGLRT